MTQPHPGLETVRSDIDALWLKCQVLEAWCIKVSKELRNHNMPDVPRFEPYVQPQDPPEDGSEG